MRERAAKVFSEIQARTCAGLEAADGQARFRNDTWKRTDGGDGGGGLTRVMSAGAIFEQAGVNFSEVFGTLPAEMAGRLELASEPTPFFATGVSMVLHPRSPHVPTMHANFRYLEAGGKRWFGGGTDLTPYYLYEDDARHFHRELKVICDRHNHEYYPEFKRRCDEYFHLPHRGETRGVGGIFFDYLQDPDARGLEPILDFVSDCGFNILAPYLPIVLRRKDSAWNDEERRFQLLRRGRYVEFNLIYDRGTLFGLKTGGRTESILMSLPPEARWDYDEKSFYGERERQLIDVLRKPRAWVE